LEYFLIFRRFAMFFVRFLRIYTTLCHSVFQMVRCGQQMIGCQHECLYLRLEHLEFKIKSEASYNGPHPNVTVDTSADTIFIQAVRMQCVGTSSCRL